jgi:asparaginyl-tRNA synthetase
MKEIYVRDIDLSITGTLIPSLFCFVKSIRRHKKVMFIQLIDSTGEIQGVIENPLIIETAKDLTKESSIEVSGIKNNNELIINNLNIINKSNEHYSPAPRSNFDVFSEQYTDLILTKKHIYLRNPKLMAIQNFRNLLLYYTRDWFFQRNFIEIAAPVITPVALYEDSTAIPVVLHGQPLFLTQCVGYYLEAACVAHERVYNISPSFRGEEGKSKRHLLEYWHIKAEIAFGNLEDIIEVVEQLLQFLTQKLLQHPQTESILKTIETTLSMDALTIPFKRMSYKAAIVLLNQLGHPIEYGKSISTRDEEILSNHIGGTFWLTGIPRSVEPFPYRIDTDDTDLTVVADLIASNGYGELLGVAEKIFDIQELEIRMTEKNKWHDARYDWIKEVHNSGCPPHIAFGMGVERLIRWLLNIPHVRDAHPYPRVFGRTIKV